MSGVECAHEIESGSVDGGKVVLDDELDARSVARVVVRVVEGTPVHADNIVICIIIYERVHFHGLWLTIVKYLFQICPQLWRPGEKHSRATFWQNCMYQQLVHCFIHSWWKCQTVVGGLFVIPLPYAVFVKMLSSLSSDILFLSFFLNNSRYFWHLSFSIYGTICDLGCSVVTIVYQKRYFSPPLKIYLQVILLASTSIVMRQKTTTSIEFVIMAKSSISQVPNEYEGRRISLLASNHSMLYKTKPDDRFFFQYIFECI